MFTYRLFHFEDGHIRSADAFEAENDAVALARAEKLRRGRPAELWSYSRVVRKFPARQDA